MLQETQKIQVKTEPLRWLFTAQFANGDIITQTQEDKSETREGGSAFTDVLARESELVTFQLNHIDGNQQILVDLQNGAFMVNGTPLHAHNQFFEAEKYELKLIYFRETRIEQDQKATVQDDMTVKTENTGTPRHYVNRYFIGWQTTVNKKNKQVTIAVG